MNADTFMQNFGHLADARSGVQRLREMVHRLALRGRLSEQLSSDDLLPDCRSDTASPLNVDQLPPNWRVVQLNAVTAKRSGNSKLIKGRLHSEPGSGRVQGYSAAGPDVWCDEAEHDGDAIIVSAVGARCGKAFRAKGLWCAIANTQILWPDNEFFDTDFAFLVFNDETFWVRSGSAQPFVNFPPSLDRSFALPPIAEQHRIVAKVDELMALCDELDTRQRERRTVHAHLNNAALDRLTSAENDTDFKTALTRVRSNFDLLYSIPENVNALRQTILQLAVQGILEPANENNCVNEDVINSMETERLSLEFARNDKEKIVSEYTQIRKRLSAESRLHVSTRAICNFISKGTTPKKTDLQESGDIPFLRVYNIVKNKLDFNYRPTFVSREIHESVLRRSRVGPGNVLMNIVGPPLGKVAVISDEYPEWNMNQALAFFRPISFFDSKFLAYVIGCPDTLHEVLQDTRGTAGQDNLSLEQARSLRIPLVTLEYQIAWVSMIDHLMALCDELESKLTQQQADADRLTEAMVAAILNGAATPNLDRGIKC